MMAMPEPGIDSLKVNDLKKIARDLNVEGYSSMKKNELLVAIEAKKEGSV